MNVSEVAPISTSIDAVLVGLTLKMAVSPTAPAVVKSIVPDPPVISIPVSGIVTVAPVLGTVRAELVIL